jgi:transposase-like protein/IS1 family transposase
MASNQPSIIQAQNNVRNFKPPYCANPACSWHHSSRIDQENPFAKYGTAKIQRYPYIRSRFRCRKCRVTFSNSFFALDFRDRTPDRYEDIFERIVDGLPLRRIAQRLNLTEGTIRRKKRKLSRWGLLHWSRDIDSLEISESVAYDGLENFSFSQYEPNYVNHAIGRDSLFIYDLNFSPLNRKGKMTQDQVDRLHELDAKHGRFNPKAIQESTQRIFERLLSKSEFLTIHTDDHHAYKRALKTFHSKNFEHLITPSKLARNYRNRLFVINHADNLSRHHLAPFRRETISFAKNAVSMMETYVLFSIHKNYMRPQFVKKQRRNPLSNIQSPAMALGLREKVQTFRQFFRSRLTVHQVQLNEDWINLFDCWEPSSRHCITPYAGI